MNRRVACTLVLLWCASAWAQEPSRPKLSGTWTLVRSQSTFHGSGPMPGSTVLRTVQKAGAVLLSETLASQDQSDTSDFEIATDGRETIRKDPFQTYIDRASWEGGRLTIASRFEGDWGEGTRTSTYSLSPDGNTLTLEESAKIVSLDSRKTLVFRRSDGEPSPALPRLTLSPLGWGHLNGHYPVDETILLQLAITNDQPVPVELRLRDHGKDGNHEPLWSLAARVTDDEGRMLTRDVCCEDEDGWWTSAFVRSESCAPGECEMPGDYVTLAPGQTVLRVAELRSLIWNCPALMRMHRTTLPSGAYHVQLTVDGLVSDTLRIVVFD